MKLDGKTYMKFGNSQRINWKISMSLRYYFYDTGSIGKDILIYFKNECMNGQVKRGSSIYTLFIQ